MQENKGLVILEQCYDMAHAHILRGLLEANDIPCFLNGEHHNRMESYMTLGLGGIRVMVLADDLEKARALIVPEDSNAPVPPKPLLQKPYGRTLLLALIGWFAGAPVMKAKGKHEA